MAGYSWIFSVSPSTIDRVTVSNGYTTVTIRRSEFLGFETSDFIESDTVSVMAAGYTTLTNIAVGTPSLTMTEASDIHMNILSNGTTDYIIEDAAAYHPESAITATATEINYLTGVSSAVQTQLNNKQATLVSGTNIKTVNNNSILGSGNIDIDALPSQTGHAGEFLTTNGTTASWAPGQANGANTDLSNLTSTGKNIGNWSNNVTNCLTEIPQDIKLELNNGTLTLKAGSIFYAPNGAGVFDKHTTSSDKTLIINTNGVYFVVITSDGYDNIGSRGASGATSGTTPPSTGLFYNTSTNEINWYSNGTKSYQYGFPLGIVTVSNGTISSIDQVFNGFGYIGSTIFALPGIKGLYPNGRNTDGTLNNTAFIIDSVKTIQTSYNADFAHIGYHSSGLLVYISDNDVRYNSNDNYLYLVSTGAKWTGAYIGTCAVSGLKFSWINPYQPFKAIDYSDSEYISNCAMPSGKRISLTLPTSGNTITAPVDGYFAISKASNDVGQYLVLYNIPKAMRVCSYTPVSGYILNCLMPVSKGDVITVSYSAGGNTSFCVFVYANGSK